MSDDRPPYFEHPTPWGEPCSCTDPSANFHGHGGRCGEHRTVGAHRAWCFECSEWCYPELEASCAGCLRSNAQIAT